MLFDTNFLITYQRGAKDVPKKRALAFLEAQPKGAPFFISRVAWMEFVAGFETSAAAKGYLANCPRARSARKTHRCRR